MMITDELRSALSKYLIEYYVEPTESTSDYDLDFSSIKGSYTELPTTDGTTLEQLVKGIGDSFHEKLFKLIEQSGMTDVEVYKKANIDRKLFSKIRSNPAYHPSKQTILALAISLGLNITETIDLLSRAEYALSPGNKGDLIVKYFIEHGVYDIMTINFALDEYGQEVLA